LSRDEKLYHGTKVLWLWQNYLIKPEYAFAMLEVGLNSDNERIKINSAQSILTLMRFFVKEGVVDLEKLKDNVDIEKLIVPDKLFTKVKELGLQKVMEQNPAPDNLPASNVHLSKNKGMKIDYIRVINCLYELGFFTDANGNSITKKDVFAAFGAAIKKDLTDYDKDLSRSLSDSTGLDKHLQVFETLKSKMTEVFNSK
jgi:hypothetical protein